MAVGGSGKKKFCVRLQSLPIVPACALGRRHELLLLTKSLKSSLEPPNTAPELPRSSPRGVSYSGKILGQIWTCEAAGLAAPTHLRPATHRLLHTVAVGAGSDQMLNGSYKRAQISLKMAHRRALKLITTFITADAPQLSVAGICAPSEIRADQADPPKPYAGPV